MRKTLLLIVLGISCYGCANNDPVERPYIISQSQIQEQQESASE